MKILYIDTRVPSHNQELHVNFIKYLHDKNFCEIIPFGNYLYGHFDNPISRTNENVSLQLDRALTKHKPDAILTYNKNGSDYLNKRDNVQFYSWIEDALSSVDIAKFHVTTDYCRSGFVPDQAKWFEDMGYTAAIFRHRASLEYPCPVDKFFLPFSIDAHYYAKFSNKIYLKKNKKVAFLGTSFASPKLYSKRISAIKCLKKHNLLDTSKSVDSSGQTQIILGKAYHEFLSDHMFSLTCGGTCNYLTAKYFQIPALQSMLVCSDTDGLDLFPENTYIKYSEENIEKLYEDVLYHIRNKTETKDKTMELYRHVITNHNHKVRGLQFVDYMKKKAGI